MKPFKNPISKRPLKEIVGLNSDGTKNYFYVFDDEGDENRNI